MPNNERQSRSLSSRRHSEPAKVFSAGFTHLFVEFLGIDVSHSPLTDILRVFFHFIAAVCRLVDRILWPGIWYKIGR